MDQERVLTKHPRGKKGVNISKIKYGTIKSSIINCLEDRKLTHLELTKCVSEKLRGKFQGSVNWYVETVWLNACRQFMAIVF